MLESAYGYSREDIAKALDATLRTSQLLVEDAEFVWTVLRDYRVKAVDFADRLLLAVNEAQGCECTATLHRRAAKLHGFRLIA